MAKVCSEFDPSKPVYQIKLPAFTEKQLLKLCSVNLVHVKRFAPRVEGKRKVRGGLLIPRLPKFIELLKKAHSEEIPLRWADNIDISVKSLTETALYTNEPFLFRLQLMHPARYLDSNQKTEQEAKLEFEKKRAEAKLKNKGKDDTQQEEEAKFTFVCAFIKATVRIEIARAKNDVVLGGFFKITENQL